MFKYFTTGRGYGRSDARGSGGCAGRGRARGTAQAPTAIQSVAGRPAQVSTTVHTTVNKSEQGLSHTSDAQTSVVLMEFDGDLRSVAAHLRTTSDEPNV